MAFAASHALGPLEALAGDWTGWDEGWTLVVFPLGIPLALLLALRRPRPAALGTLAVWGWALVVLVAWWLLDA